MVKPFKGLSIPIQRTKIEKPGYPLWNARPSNLFASLPPPQRAAKHKNNESIRALN